MLKSIKVLGILFCCFGILLFILFLTSNYYELTNYLLKYLKFPESKLPKLRTQLPQYLHQVFYVISILILIVGVYTVRLSKKIAVYFSLFRKWAYSVLKVFLEMPKKILIIAASILLISFIINLYFAMIMPISYDEAWTYLNFTKRSILSSISYYPAPNNHVLHSIFTNLTYSFPFSQSINLRLPSLIFSCVASLCFFYTFTMLLNEKISLLLLVFFCFLFPTIYYGYSSRGYILVLFFFIIQFYTIMCLRNPKNSRKDFRKYIVMLSLSGVLGMYTMPSFLYPYFTSSTFILFFFLKKGMYSEFKVIIISIVISFTCVLLLYLPIIIVSGVNSIIDNKFVEPISRLEVLQQLMPHFSDTSHFLFYMPILVLIAIVLSLSVFLLVKNSKSAIFPIYCIFLAPIILLIQGVIPFPRTWIYLVVPILYLVGLFIKQSEIYKKLKLSPLVFVCVFSIFFLLNCFKQKIYTHEHFSFDAEETANFLIEKDAKKIVCHHSLIETNLAYLFEEKEVNATVYYSNAKLSNMKKIKNEYDFLITESKPLEEVNIVKVIDASIYIISFKKEELN